MKKIIISTLTLTLFTLTLHAQDISFGAGVGVGGDSKSVLKLPIDIDGEYRVEPEIALMSVDEGAGSDSSYSLGSGFYMLHKSSENTSLYYGAKAIFGDNLSTQFSTEISAVAGFEYFMDSQVSLGAEASFGFGFGDVSGYATDSSVNLRYYF